MVSHELVAAAAAALSAAAVIGGEGMEVGADCNISGYTGSLGFLGEVGVVAGVWGFGRPRMEARLSDRRRRKKQDRFSLWEGTAPLPP